MKILKEKTNLKILNEVQEKAKTRLATFKDLITFAESQVKIFNDFMDLYIHDENLLDKFANKKFCFSSAEFLNDNKPFYAGRHGGIKALPSSTLIQFKIIDFKSIQILSIKRY